jgi:hypothetical protein
MRPGDGVVSNLRVGREIEDAVEEDSWASRDIERAITNITKIARENRDTKPPWCSIFSNTYRKN